MAGSSGTTWHRDEVRATVETYFAVWRRGATTKADAYRGLARRFPDRTVKAFEYKFQNISAVLEILGQPWMPGVKPKSNFQRLLREEVERFLNAETTGS